MIGDRLVPAEARRQPERRRQIDAQLPFLGIILPGRASFATVFMASSSTAVVAGLSDPMAAVSNRARQSDPAREPQARGRGAATASFSAHGFSASMMPG